MAFRPRGGIIGGLIVGSCLLLGTGPAAADRTDGWAPTTAPTLAGPPESSVVSLPRLPGIGELSFPASRPAEGPQARSVEATFSGWAGPQDQAIVGAESSPGLRPILILFGGLLVAGSALLLVSGARRRRELDPTSG